MFSEWVLGLWSAAGIVWWLIAWRLVTAEAKRSPELVPPPESEEFLSIFKPLPPLGATGLESLKHGLESFISQLDDKSELLLGIHEADRERTTDFIARMRARFSAAQLTPIFRSEPDEAANPKIAWQIVLARHARGELWLWSDSDIVAPPNFLQAARAEYARCGAAVLTFPYGVRETANASSILDALFVNAEFYPGVLLLRSRGPVDFAFGAGALFRRDDFLRQVDWREIGSALADDFVLGQKIGPVRISANTTLATVADTRSWSDALMHYLRWSKTIWWNRPVASAARILVLPVGGWMLYVALNPLEAWRWIGLVMMIQVDVLFASAICRAVGCRWRRRDWFTSEAWSLWRVFGWLACWLPWPVSWSGRTWWGPTIAPGKELLRRRH